MFCKIKFDGTVKFEEAATISIDCKIMKVPRLTNLVAVLWLSDGGPFSIPC
jgi:hypothetical protein